MFSGREDVPQKKGMDLWKHMSSKCSFTCICGIVLPLNPPATTVYARSACYPNLHFTQSLHFTPGPQSAVCSSQSALTDRSKNPCFVKARFCPLDNVPYSNSVLFWQPSNLYISTMEDTDRNDAGKCGIFRHIPKSNENKERGLISSRND